MMRVVYGSAIAGIGAVLLSDVWLDVDYEFLANLSLLAMTGLSTVFALRYLFRSKWWTNRIGRIYLAKSLMLSLVLIQIVLASWWADDYPGRQQVRFAIYSLGAVAYVSMVVSLWREQQRDLRIARERHH